MSSSAKNVMGKKFVYTKVTPLPKHIPRQLALDMLHSHAEVIELNPLVTGIKSIEAPRDSLPDEYFSQWYEISQVITWGFGMKKKIAFKGVFHDQPWGMQSHVYAPMGVDLRNKYRIGGNQPDEPREVKELGVNTPDDGLYLREDVEITCNVALMSYVKKEAQSATAIMISRLTRKAELLDEGKLHAMFEQGKLKTRKPSQSATFEERLAPDMLTSPSSPLPPGSPDVRHAETFRSSVYSPAVDAKGFGNYHEVVGRSPSVRQSVYLPQQPQSGYDVPDYARPGADGRSGGQQQFSANELPGSYYHAYQADPYPQHQPNAYPQQQPRQQVFRSELEGDSVSLQPHGLFEAKPPPPTATHPALQNQQPNSPQPNPAQLTPGQPNRWSRASFASSNGSSLPLTHDGGRHSSEANYRLANPDMRDGQSSPNASQHRGSEASVQQWQQTVQNDGHVDSSSYRNSRGSAQLEPDHQHFARLSVSRPPENNAPNASGPERISKCPVCGLFEGDEKAVMHHVTNAHFA